MTRGHRRLRAALFLGVGLGMTGLALVGYGTNVFRQLELSTVDTRFSIRGKVEPPENLVVVAIDDKTFNDLQLQWPFPRSRHARVIDRLREDGATTIAYDVQFTEPSVEAEDNALIAAVERAKRVVLAATEVDEEGNTNVFGGFIPPGSRAGNALIPADAGGVFRRVPHSVDKLETFAIATAETATGRQIEPSELGGETAWIDYHGRPGTIRTISFSDVLLERTRSGFFRDKVVVVGPEAPTLQDVHPTSTSGGEVMSGAEIEANAISTALRGFPLKNAPRGFNVLLIVLLGMLAPITSLRLQLRWTLGLAIGAGLLHIVGTQLAFENGWITSFVYPLGALVLSTVGSVGAHYLLAAFERERVRDVFSRFVPEAVVDQVLARTDDDLRLGGVELEGTSMFTDLRGFTSFAETLPAERVIEVLNHYLGEMSEAILDHGGTLVAYMGDGIFAVFGAPIEQIDHADRAVECARELLTVRLPRFNEWLRSEELGEGFRMGIGLNSGMFMSGNVGSARRLEYAAIGDTTNTASRLEGMTKGTPHMLFVSDTTRASMRGETDGLVFVDEFEIRGRQNKVKIWSIQE